MSRIEKCKKTERGVQFIGKIYFLGSDKLTTITLAKELNLFFFFTTNNKSCIRVKNATYRAERQKLIKYS